MANIIPAILESDIGEVQKKLDQLAGLTEWAQIDLADGKFVDNLLVKPEELSKLKTEINLEIHLMVKEPESWIIKLKNKSISRVYFHIEAEPDPRELILRIIDLGFRPGLAINLETKIEVVEPYLNSLDNVLFMAIKPGWQGQAFRPEVLDRIRDFRGKNANISIAIDGGINKTNIREVAISGVDNINVGSAIFADGDVKNNLFELRDNLT